MSPKYSVILPVLNERENLQKLLPELVSPDVEIIVCDNGSTDGTVEFIHSIPTVKLSQGLGSVTDAILRGFSLVSDGKVVVMDSDLSHPPWAVKDLVESLDYSDIVVGSRYILQGCNKDSTLNRLVSSFGNLLAWGLAPRLTDRMSGMFAIRTEFARVPIRDTSKPMLEFLVRSGISKVGEVPITFVPRQSGSSKIGRSFKTLLKGFWDLFLLYLFKYRRPVKFLVVGGIGIGVNLGLLWVLTEKAHLWYVLSSFLAIITTTVYSYLANNYWTFERKKLL